MSASSVFSCHRWPSIHRRWLAWVYKKEGVVWLSSLVYCLHSCGSLVSQQFPKWAHGLYLGVQERLSFTEEALHKDGNYVLWERLMVRWVFREPRQHKWGRQVTWVWSECKMVGWKGKHCMNSQVLLQVLWRRSSYSASMLLSLPDAPYSSRTPHGPWSKLVFSNQEGCAVYAPGEGAECWWCGKPFYTELQERGRMSFWRFSIPGFKNFLSGVWRLASAQARSSQICPLPPALCFQLHPSLHPLSVGISNVICLPAWCEQPKVFHIVCAWAKVYSLGESKCFQLLESNNVD